MKPMKLFFCLLLAAVCLNVSPALARTLSPDEARDVALRFFSEKGRSPHSKAYFDKHVESIRVGTDGVAPYVFQTSDGQFVIVSREETDRPMLAFGNDGRWGEADEGMRNFLASLGRGVAAQPTVVTQTVEPLVKNVRSQGAPFNNHCPYLTYADGSRSQNRCLVGCVATALEQILTYYRFPEQLQDTLFGWRTANYTVDTIAPGTPLCFDDILDVYEENGYTAENVEAVSLLDYYCGIAARMNWGLNASGASVSRLVEPLRRAFGYRYVRSLYSGAYTPEHWRELLLRELTSGRPVLYAGYTSLIQGHAFVIDGVNSDGFYHVCWGYGGQYDGYYNLSVLNTYENPQYPTETGRWLGHFCNQEMLVLNPDSVGFEEGDTITDFDNLRIDSVVYSRLPDCNHYTTLKIHLKNITSQPISTTVELLTFEEGDTAAFRNGDYVALTGADIEADGEKWVTAYCRFTQSGRRVLGISDNDSSFLYLDTLNVDPASGQGVSVVAVDSLIDSGSATFYVTIQNNSDTSWAGNMITYSLFMGAYTDSEGDRRQWDVLNLAPAASQTDTIRFEGLLPATDYTFVVRNPWLPAAELSFTTAVNTGVSPLRTTPDSETDEPAFVYDLQGRRLSRREAKGIVIVKRNGRWIKQAVR